MYLYFKEEEAALKASFTFSNFSTAFAFMTEVAILAERMNHHPNWSNVYNKVTIELNTHDAGNEVTALDHEMAKSIERLVTKYLN